MTKKKYNKVTTDDLQNLSQQLYESCLLFIYFSYFWGIFPIKTYMTDNYLGHTSTNSKRVDYEKRYNLRPRSDGGFGF